jgi:hypothetical protein
MVVQSKEICGMATIFSRVHMSGIPPMGLLEICCVNNCEALLHSKAIFIPYK